MIEPCIIESGYFPPSKETYKGDLNIANQRTGKGEQIRQQSKSFERYQGEFFQDSLHGCGIYTCLKDKKDFLVEGTFYCNSIHGYSTIAYSNESYFEGLIRKNKRFGPGVLTYSNGNQDVGLWNGDQLSRLCYMVFPEYLPKLAYSELGMKKLLRFKMMVLLFDDTQDNAEEVLKKLGASKKIIKLSNELYNPFVRDINSLMFDKKIHDDQIYQEIDEFIDVDANETDLVDLTLKNKEIEDDLSKVFDYLIENKDDLIKIPENSRLSFVESKIIDEKSDLIKKINFDLIKSFLEVFFKELDVLLDFNCGERNLLSIKNKILRNLPETYKYDSIPFKKVLATQVLAWNNSEESIEMLKYTFKNKNLEKNVSFNIRNLLIGDRSKFSPPGDYELNCIRFLQESSIGNYHLAAKLLIEKNINPDVSDSKGNVAVMFASAKDKWRVLKMLCNFGADLDKLNDDGLSALSMCILRYVAIKNDVIDWERAFFNDVNEKVDRNQEDLQWRSTNSLVNLKAPSTILNLDEIINEEDLVIKNNLLERESLMGFINLEGFEKEKLEIYYDEIKKFNVDVDYQSFQGQYEVIPDLNQKYLFLTELKKPAVKKVKIGKVRSKKSSKKSNKSTKSSKKSNKSKKSKKKKSTLIKLIKDEEEKIDPKLIMKQQSLNIVLTTIKILLHLGCDPNYCKVPLPSVLISIYTDSKDIFDLLLEFKANPNTSSQKDGLTPLLLLCCLPFSPSNAEMFEALLKSGANPNLKATPNHWIEEKIKLLGLKSDSTSIVDNGKNSLHILSMRYDFETDFDAFQLKMIGLLLNYKADLNEKYLGHTPFSIAVLRGNTNLIRWFVESKLVEPYAVFGENMGNALTILILKRFNLILPLEMAEEVYDVLVELNFNPLVDILNFGNAIEFMEEEYKLVIGEKKEKKGKKDKKSQKSKKGKKNPVDELKKYLLLKTKEMLQRNVLAKAFIHLRTIIILATNQSSEIIKILINFFNLKTIQKFLQLLIDREILEDNTLNVMVIYKFLNLMNDFLKKKDNKRISIGDVFSGLSWRIKISQESSISELIEPEIDKNEDIYKVCFNCCKKLDKNLIICPICGLVYFCSQECNKLSIKQSTIHNCKSLFYEKEKFKASERLKLGDSCTELNQLEKSLNAANTTIYKALKTKFGRNEALNMLSALTTKDGLLNIDKLMESCEFIQNFIDEKLGIVGIDAKELKKTLAEFLTLTKRKQGKSTCSLSRKNKSRLDLEKRSKMRSKSKLSAS